VDNGCCRFESNRGDVLVLSEPLDGIEAAWREVPENRLLIAGDGQVEIRPFGV
jgi:hypothetical protein